MVSGVGNKIMWSPAELIRHFLSLPAAPPLTWRIRVVAVVNVSENLPLCCALVKGELWVNSGPNSPDFILRSCLKSTCLRGNPLLGSHIEFSWLFYRLYTRRPGRGRLRDCRASHSDICVQTSTSSRENTEELHYMSGSSLSESLGSHSQLSVWTWVWDLADTCFLHQVIRPPSHPFLSLFLSLGLQSCPAYITSLQVFH